MSSNLAAGKALELVDTLKAIGEQFAARAQKLNAEFQSASSKERRRAEAAIAEQTNLFSAAVADAESTFEVAKVAAQSKFERRKVRIGQAYQASKEAGLRKVEEKVGGRKYELQKRMLQAERDRDAALAAATAAWQEFRQNLATDQETLARLEREAQSAFRGYATFLRGFFEAYQHGESQTAGDEHRLQSELRVVLTKAGAELRCLRKRWLLLVLKPLPLWLVLIVLPLPLVPLLQYAGFHSFTYFQAGTAAGAGLVLLLLRAIAARRAAPLAASLAKALASARRLHDASQTNSEQHYHQELERVRGEFVTATRTADQQLKQAVAEAGDLRVSCRMRSDERTVRANEKNVQMLRTKLTRLEHQRTDALQQTKQASDVRTKALTDAAREIQGRLATEHRGQWRILQSEWKSRLEPLYATLATATTAAKRLFPPWDAPFWAKWAPPEQFGQAAQFAHMEVDLAKLCEALPPGLAGADTSTPSEQRLELPGPSKFSLPLCLAYPQQGSLLFETGPTGHDQAIGALNNTILRLLSVSPPGRLNFTVIDPVGLGQNFAGVMHIADYEEQIINNRIWTQSTQIEQKLADLNEHMEKVIQMYLRNEYATIAEYNEQAGVIAEKYYFLVVADFPASFTDTAAKRLTSIAASGARCGVYMLIHWDHRLPLPQDFIPDELRKSCVTIGASGAALSTDRSSAPRGGPRNPPELVIGGKARPGAELILDAPPPPEMATELVHQIGRASRDSSRVEVPFEHVVPPDAQIWSEETTAELRVPIGRTGATKLQYLAIGKGTRQHGLVAGKTGSGKSTLFHVIITNLALWCSPEQVEFYLVDFKKGVEFKCYASKRLPHARVVAIESDREFGLSVLQRLDEELKRRGDLFRQLGVQDVAGYKRSGGTEAIPRTLLLIDEFQEFFVEDDKISQTASLLLDRIVRQGRAFGIHVLLGSQTLGGAYTVARTTLGQMVIRIALQCNEADAYLIMDDTNPAPRLLSRPGEGIYNDMAGALEGNSPFQVVWLPDEVRDTYLSKVRARADREGVAYPGPIVFEGNAPADARENPLLRNLLAAPAIVPPSSGRIWLGAPNSIKGPTEAAFQRQSGNNLLIIGQRDEAILAILSTGLVALAAQYPLGSARFILCDATAPGTPPREFLEKVVGAIPHPVTLAKPGELPQLMKELAEEKNRRSEAADADAAPPVFLFIHDLQKFSRLRYEEDFGFSAGDAAAEPNAAAVLNDLVCEGTRLGFHVIVTCDTYNNVNRFLSRKAFSEFEMRVLFQMSANDSASLIDNPKAGMLGLHRALFFNAQEGYLETFRPYALPPVDWVADAGRNLTRLLGAVNPVLPGKPA